MKALLATLLALSLAAGASRPARAAVNVERTGAENPMVEVARSTLYGGLTGLMLGGALAVANNGHDAGNYLRWGFAGGTFFGFAYGLYHVSSRPSPRALLEIENGAPRWSAPELAIGPDGTLHAPLLAARF